jgi:Arc/MetJ-type ribon-helix-helix transcriptional regulator
LKRIPVSLPEDLIDRAKELADSEDRFLSDVIREAVELLLKTRDAEEDEVDDGEDLEDEDEVEEEEETTEEEK